MNNTTFQSDVVSVTIHETLPPPPYLPNKVILTGTGNEYNLHVTTWDGQSTRHLAAQLSSAAIEQLVIETIIAMNIVSGDAYIQHVDTDITSKNLYTSDMLAARIQTIITATGATLTDQELNTLISNNMDGYITTPTLTTAITAAITDANYDTVVDRDVAVDTGIATLSLASAEIASTTSQLPTKHTRAPLKQTDTLSREAALFWGFNSSRNLFIDGSRLTDISKIRNITALRGFTPTVTTLFEQNNSDFGTGLVALTPAMRELGLHRNAETGDNAAGRYSFVFGGMRYVNTTVTFAGVEPVLWTAYLALPQVRITFFIYANAGTVQVHNGDSNFYDIPVGTGKQVEVILNSPNSGYTSAYLVKGSQDADFEIMLPKLYLSQLSHPLIHNQTYPTMNINT